MGAGEARTCIAARSLQAIAACDRTRASALSRSLRRRHSSSGRAGLCPDRGLPACLALPLPFSTAQTKAEGAPHVRKRNGAPDRHEGQVAFASAIHVLEAFALLSESNYPLCPIEDMGLSAGVVRILKGNGLHTSRQVVDAFYSDLGRRPGCGKVTVQAVATWINSYTSGSNNKTRKQKGTGASGSLLPAEG